jgi:hypothetical protein
MRVKNIRVVGLGLAGLLVAGCGSGVRLAGREASPTSVTSVTTATSIEVQPVTAASNKAKAEAEATRLLKLVAVPPGSVASTGAPLPSLAVPPVSPGSSASLVDRSGSWTVPSSPSATLRWFAEHHPGGLSQSGTGSLSTHGVTTVSGYGYSAPASAAWADALVEIAVAPIGPSSSELRADGLTVWIDPVPLRDDQPGPRMHVDVASGCPASDRGIVGVTNPGAPLNESLVPMGAPSSGLVCEYSGLNGNAFALKHSAPLDAAAAAAFATHFRQIPLGHVDGAASFCPMDDGSASLVALAYLDHREVDVWMQTTGCTSVANGSITASMLGVS